MTELLYLFLGWLFGLISPRIIDSIKAAYERKELAAAIRSEAEDLQYRVAITSFLIVQRYDKVTREYLLWLKPKLHQYKGNEPVEAIRDFVEQLLASDDIHLLAVAEHMHAAEGVGLSLKQFSAGLIESNLAKIQSFPIKYQRVIHEFRNQLSSLNQEIERAQESLRMTFDSSISDDNHKLLTADLIDKYKIIQGMCMRVSDRLQSVICYDSSKL